MSIFLQFIPFFFINISFILCTCKLSVLNICQSIDDLNIQGNINWKYVAISPEICQNTDSQETAQQLKSSAFESTPNLEHVYISAKLNAIDEYAFYSLKNIQLIKLWRNKLPVIQTNTFSGLNHLHALDLEDNDIENLQHNCLSNSSIKEIDLSHNKLTNIQVDMLNLKSLDKIVLSGNQLMFLVDNCFGVNVQYLDLSKNKISALSVGVLDKLTQLKHLNLSRNELRSIVEDFGKVTALRTVTTLDLSYNIIEVIEKDSLTQVVNLRNLYLNDNKIQYLSSDSFPATTNFRIFHLHRNFLQGLDPDLGNKMGNLKQITLGGNPWICMQWLNIERHLASVRPTCDAEATSGENPVCAVKISLASEAEAFNLLYKCQF